MWLWEMWLQLLQAGSQRRAPQHRPGMFEHWVTQPSAHTLTSLFAILFLSLCNSHTLFSEPICPWGAYAMQRSNTNFTACARYNLIFCDGEMEEWAKKEKPPQTNNSSLCDNCSMEISPSRSFHLIRNYRRCSCANTQSLHAALVFLLYRLQSEKKSRHTDADWICPSRGFQSVIISEFRLLDFQQKSRIFIFPPLQMRCLLWITYWRWLWHSN